MRAAASSTASPSSISRTSRISRTPALVTIGTRIARFGKNFERAFGRKPLHRLAHRHQAGAKGAGELTQRDLFARLDAADHQEVAQLVVDALAQRAAVDRVETGEIGRFDVHGSARDDNQA